MLAATVAAEPEPLTLSLIGCVGNSCNEETFRTDLAPGEWFQIHEAERCATRLFITVSIPPGARLELRRSNPRTRFSRITRRVRRRGM
jgi:hypothetical protein